MDYKRIYDEIIDYRRENRPTGYSERHHVIPRSLGGSDEDSNLVRLTAREHFLCHCLLAKMFKYHSFEWYKMNHALMMMKCNNISQDRYYNSKLYEYFRINFSDVMSNLQSGNKNSQYNRMWICNPKSMKNKKILKCDNVPHGWVKGRNIWKIDNVKLEKIQLKEKRDKDIKDHTIYYWELYKNGSYDSLNDFHRKSNYEYSRITMIKRFSKYVEDYSSYISQGKNIMPK
ncbi:homing endonuclease [Vibrio phage VB_VaC_TDDLMA]